MPIDPNIALQGRPIEIAPPDWNKTYLTLAQLGYLGAEGEKARAGAAFTNTQNQQALATLGVQQALRAAASGIMAGPSQEGGSSLSAITPDMAQAPASGGVSGAFSGRGAPGSSAGTVTPPPGAGMPPAQGPPQAQPPPDTMTQIRQFMAIDPEIGATIGKSLLAHKQQDLENQAKVLETSKAKLASANQYLAGVSDDAGYQLAKGYAQALGANTSGWPDRYNKPVVDQLVKMNISAQDQVVARQKDIQLGIDQVNANSRALEAQSGAITARHMIPQPTATGAATFDPVTGTWKIATAPTPGGGETPITTPGQASRAQELNSGWMNNAQNQQFLASKQGITDLQTAAKLKTGSGDMALVSAYIRVIDPRAGSSPAKVDEILQLGTLSQQAQRELGRLFTNGTQLSPIVRQELVTAAQKTYDTRVSEHQLMRKHMVNMATDLGVQNPERVIPDLSIAPGASAPSTAGAGGGKVYSLDDLNEMMKEPQAKGKTRAEMVHQLAQKGWRLRPGEGGP